MKIDGENFLREMKCGNEKSLEYVIDEYSALVNGIVRKVLGSLKNEFIIEECISDVFLGAWNNIDKFTGDSIRFRGWIGSIARYKAIDYYRKHIKETLYSEFKDDAYHVSNDLEESIIRNIDTENLLNLICKFDEPDRSIFMMKFLLGCSTKAIAGKLKMTCQNVDVRVMRGRRRLKLQYEDMERRS